AADFLQIPPHDGHPCLKLTVGTINPHIGLSPTSKRPCWAHQKKGDPVTGIAFMLILNGGGSGIRNLSLLTNLGRIVLKKSSDTLQ
ncbi:MAG: hypothetical protein P9L90_08215, partial [Candidatus Aadella gelida]|nr:hypothetical protein [Candidatus Aadella gelida]